MTVEEIKDDEYQEATITQVEEEDDGYVVTHDGLSLWCKGKAVVPRVGDTIRMYGKGFGYHVRGIAINGQVVRYESEADVAARWDREGKDRKQRMKEEAAAKRDESMERISKLPDPFQKRIKGFLDRNPDFEWEHLSYELFVCEQANAFAEAFPGNPDGLKEWHGLPYEKQRKLVPAMDDGHSGNTFGMAARLAMFALTNPELIEQEHGALCPLVGCTEYGCKQASAVKP